MTETNETGALGRRISSDLGSITLSLVKDVCFANARANAAAIASGRSVMALRDQFSARGDAALIVAAGPSLHRQPVIDSIRAFASIGTIIATESCLSFLLRHDVVPDLIVTVDPDDDSAASQRILRWFGDPNLSADILEKDDYFARQDMDPSFAQNELRSNAELVELVNRYGPQVRVGMASCASSGVVRRAIEAGMGLYWWNPMLDDDELPNSLTRELHEMNGLPCINAGGNVGTACWTLAHAALGIRRIGLVGVDFGYYDDLPYSRTQYYREILDLVGADRLDEVFVRIHNPHVGRDFYTDPAYLWYRDAFLEMAETADCETFNCTGGGILFGPGVQWASLDEFVQQCRSENASR